MKRQGIIFTFDALLGGLLLIAAMLVVLQHYNEATPVTQTTHYSQDALLALNSILLKDVQDPWVESMINNGTIDENKTVLEQIGNFWATNQSDYATNLTTAVLDGLLPAHLGASFELGGETFYTATGASNLQRSVGRRMITGVQKGSALEGSTSTAYLKRIQGRELAQYIYFGGFVGQGNITALMTLPSDINVTRITEFDMELDVAADFQLFINGAQCGATYSPNATSGNFTPDYWDLIACEGSLQADTNTFLISFPGGVNTAYIGGGFIRVVYTSDVFKETTMLGEKQQRFPGIEGVVNLYDSFNVPGNLSELHIYLHYFANHSSAQNYTFYMTIGNDTILLDTNSTSEQFLTFDNSTLGSQLNYSLFSGTTVPLRIGFQNLTFATSFIGNADVVIVTDVSGSMSDEMGSTSNGAYRNCDHANYNDSDTTRLSVAKCLDRDFGQNILNYSGNELGLISYEDSTDVSDTVALTQNFTLINETIGTSSPLTGYTAGGSTCICCGINSARDLLIAGLSVTSLISSGQSWLYDNTSFYSTPPNDGEGDQWFEDDYDDSSWPSGTAILGSTNGYTYTPTVTTELGNNLSLPSLYVDLWEHTSDTAGPPADFTSGILNSTANTFGLGGGDDGWDTTTSGLFGFTGSLTIDGIVGGDLRLTSNSGTDTSGGYGIEVNITQEMYNVIAAGGQATVTFDWQWEDTGSHGSADQVWVKATWEQPGPVVNYLGTDLDAGDNGADGTTEIFTAEDPDTDGSGTYSQSIGQWITGPGMHYLTLGGKLRRDDSNDDGWWEFDDVQIEITGDLPGVLYADFWEDAADNSGPPADFSSGNYNSTANTFGLGAGDDGWDSASGTFNYTGSVTFNNIQSGRLEIDTPSNSNDVSGAYGIEVNISDEMWNILQNNGRAILSFDWWWNDQSSFGSADEVWVKAAWNSSTSGLHYLGSDLDTNHNPSDSTPEIYADDDPDGDTGQQSYFKSIEDWIEGPGTYYLILGGKLKRDDNDDNGEWYFDNIQLKITNLTNHYYFRKHFTITNLSAVQRGVVSILSDDYAEVYVNGNLVDSDVSDHLASYWNRNGIDVSASYFKTGDNVVAVDLSNSDQAAKFDLQLIGLNDSRVKAMLVMSDGQANVQCAEQSTGSSTQDAIQAACDAREDYGIVVHAVGYSDFADGTTLEGVAECGSGLYISSSNTTELDEFYTDVAVSILEAALQSQTVVVQGSYEESVLYNDSYINITYQPIAEQPQPEELELVFQTGQFNSCSPSIPIYSGLRLIDAVITSYSGEHWTDYVSTNGQESFNLSRFNPSYGRLGDPYLVQIPVDQLIPGASNSLTIRTGDGPANSTGCSNNNTLIYRGFVNSSTPRSSVVEFKEGCTWHIEFEDGTNLTTPIPGDYNGTNNCYYNSTVYPGVYNTADAYDIAVAQILDDLDFDDDGQVLVNLAEEDLEIIVTIISQIPYLWGPSVASLEVWQ